MKHVEKPYVYKRKIRNKIVNILTVKGGSRVICIDFKQSHTIEKTCKSWEELEVKAKVNTLQMPLMFHRHSWESIFWASSHFAQNIKSVVGNFPKTKYYTVQNFVFLWSRKKNPFWSYVSIVLGIQSKNERCHQKYIYRDVHQNLIFTVTLHHLSHA